MTTSMGGAHQGQLGNDHANRMQNRHAGDSATPSNQSTQVFASLINKKLAQQTYKASGGTDVDTNLRFQNSVHSSHSANTDSPMDTESELLQILRKKLNRLKRQL